LHGGSEKFSGERKGPPEAIVPAPEAIVPRLPTLWEWTPHGGVDVLPVKPYFEPIIPMPTLVGIMVFFQLTEKLLFFSGGRNTTPKIWNDWGHQQINSILSFSMVYSLHPRLQKQLSLIYRKFSWLTSAI
jgi:hypothetical protein